MSKDIIVLAPNGRRQTIHCSADTSILQVLEDVCKKQGFQPSDYDLKHHNHLLDLTSTVRFANLPNKATIEMVEAERKREEFNVTIGLQLEDGERRTADFAPNTSLYDLITSLAASELNNLQNPYILYMRQEVIGISALRQKTLKMLGLIKGRAILRLLNKADEAKQANVSAVYRVPLPENSPSNNNDNSPGHNDNRPGPSKSLDPVSLVKNIKSPPNINDNNEVTTRDIEQEVMMAPKIDKKIAPEAGSDSVTESDISNTSMTKESLERRLNIEEEVTFLGTQKAIAFMQPDGIQNDIDDLPDEFYELTIEEVRKLYHDLQQHRIVLENTPLITSTKKEELDRESSQRKLNEYRNVVVRIQFPDNIILQGVFQPANTIEDITNFVKEHLKRPEKKFHIFTTPLKEALDPKITLQEAKFVPCVHMHFKWLEEDSDQSYLKDEIYTKKTTSDAASILASKYRAPSRRKIDSTDTAKQPNTASTSRNSKMPKWFKH